MLIGLDHVIIGVNDLDEATRVFGENLGLAVSSGGIHPSVVRLIVLL
jgi:extradiol dioxygenase family protein